jgi:hypothetical protein
MHKITFSFGTLSYAVAVVYFVQSVKQVIEVTKLYNELFGMQHSTSQCNFFLFKPWNCFRYTEFFKFQESDDSINKPQSNMLFWSCSLELANISTKMNTIINRTIQSIHELFFCNNQIMQKACYAIWPLSAYYCPLFRYFFINTT